MLDKLPLESFDGEKKNSKLILIALRTCGFCQKAKRFLEDRNFAYEHIFLDSIPLDEKKAFKEWFAQEFDQALSYPTLVINGKELLVGFVQSRWEADLNGR